METTGKVIFTTSKGPIAVELYCKEFPQLTRKFLQNCIDGTFNNLTFAVGDDRIQIESNNCTYNLPDEFHSRIRWSERGLVGVLHKAKNSNSADGFFITLMPMPQYNNHYTLIGKTDSRYTLVAINDLEHATTIQNVTIEQDFFGLREHVPEVKVEKKPKKRVALDYGDDDDDDGFTMKLAYQARKERKGDQEKEKGSEEKEKEKGEVKGSEEKEKGNEEEKEENKGIDDKDGSEEKINKPSNQNILYEKEIKQKNHEFENDKLIKVKNDEQSQGTNNNSKITNATNNNNSSEGFSQKSSQESSQKSSQESSKKSSSNSSKTQTRRRDPTVDPEYNPYLDFTDGNCDITALKQHVFGKSGSGI